MMKALSLLCILLLLVISHAPAQDATSTTNHQVLTNVEPGDSVPEPASTRVPPPPKGAIPMPLLRGGLDNPLPLGFVDQLVSFDLASRTERTMPCRPALQAVKELVPGLAPPKQDREVQPDSYNNPLSRITSQSFPWAAQCRIYFKIGTSGYIGSGTLIDARHVITAGHCVHGGQGSVWATDVRVYPAWDGDSNAYGAANGVKLYSWTGWTQSSNYSSDMGIIRLDRPVGFLTGWMGYGYDSNSLFYLSNTTHVAGYPGSSYTGAPHALYYSYGTFSFATSGILTAIVNWPYDIGGMSGSGIYYIDSGTRYVHGNLSHGPANWGSGLFDYFGACRMTSSKFNSIQNSFIPAGYPATSADYRPLNTRVTTPSGGVPAGSPLSSMDYLVVNDSLVNPASATYTVKVYLSTNDYISTSDTYLGQHTFTHNFGAKSSVRVTVTTPPTIPASMAPGTYYVGVILDVSDYDTGNNRIRDWDAAKITVLANDMVIPGGLDGLEGGASHSVPAANAPCRSQSLYDASLLRTVPSGTINHISLRRNSSGSTTCEEHRMTVDIHMSSAGVPGAGAWSRSSYAANRGSDWTPVVTGRVVDLPATAVPSTSPAPFTVVIPFTTPFTYVAGRNLLVQLDTRDDTGNGSYYWPMDAQGYSRDPLGIHSAFGVGCPSGLPFSGSMTHDDRQATLSWWWDSGGGYGTPAVGVLGVSNQSLGATSLPLGLAGFGAPGCSLYTDLGLTFPGATDAAGINGRYRVDFKFPLIPGLANQSLYAQTFVFDGSYNAAGLRASQAMRFAFGQAPTPVPALSLYTYGVAAPFSDTPRFTADRALIMGLGGL